MKYVGIGAGVVCVLLLLSYFVYKLLKSDSPSADENDRSEAGRNSNYVPPSADVEDENKFLRQKLEENGINYKVNPRRTAI